MNLTPTSPRQQPNLFSIKKHTSFFSAPTFEYEPISLPVKTEIPPPSSLTFLTYNVWFDALEKENRCIALLELIHHHKPTFICLQEVTPKFLTIMHEVISKPKNSQQTQISKTFQENYYFTGDLTKAYQTMPSYGVFMLISKSIPVFLLQNIILPTRMDRTCFVCGILFSDDTWLGVATVHLESLNNSKKRRQQLDIISTELNRYPHAFLMGDFNIDATKNYIDDGLPLENNVLKELFPDYRDTWVEIKGTEELGYTFDTETNPMLRTHRYEQTRIDRIIYKSLAEEGDVMYQAESIEIIGKAPISPNMPTIYPSDHYGLVATFKRV